MQEFLQANAAFNTGINPAALPKLIRLADLGIKRGITTFEGFLLELKLNKIIKEIEKLSPEELSLLKKTFEEARKAEKIRNVLKKEFFEKIGKELPENWNKFSPQTDIEFAEELKKFRGNNDLSFDSQLRGGEGQLFDSDTVKNRILKRWFENRVKDMPESIRLLKEAKDLVESNPQLTKYIEVVEVTEQGTDWVVRGFDPDSYPLKEALTSPSATKVRQEVRDLLSREQEEITQNILKNLTKIQLIYIGPKQRIK